MCSEGIPARRRRASIGEGQTGAGAACLGRGDCVWRVRHGGCANRSVVGASRRVARRRRLGHPLLGAGDDPRGGRMSVMQPASGVSSGADRKSIIIACAHGDVRSTACPIPGNSNHRLLRRVRLAICAYAGGVRGSYSPAGDQRRHGADNGCGRAPPRLRPRNAMKSARQNSAESGEIEVSQWSRRGRAPV